MNTPETGTATSNGELSAGDRLREIARLAATHAALDPDRIARRHDIFISACLEALSIRGPLSTNQIVREVNRMWATNSTSVEMVMDALTVAQQAGLASTVTEGGIVRWQASPAAIREAEQDREWAADILSNFESEFVRRLTDCCEVAIRPERHSRLFAHLVVAITHGAQDIYEVATQSASLEHLRPVRFEIDKIGSYIKESVDPRPVAKALAEVALEAIDPFDEFGNAFIRLLTVGNILQGMLSGRDAGAAKVLQGMRCLLDTSTLVLMVEEDETGRSLLERLITQSRESDIEVIVAEHTLDEWERLWQGAEAELGGRESAIHLPERGYILVQNPLLKAFFREQESDPSMNWSRFKIGRRDLRPYLEKVGVHVRPHGNTRERDHDLARRVRQGLIALPKNSRGRARRTQTAADADAQSCAMVARWRESSSGGLPCGWFIAPDTLTERVYQTVEVDDPYPLSVTPGKWLLFLAAMRGDDPEGLNQLALALSDVVTREAFFSVATGYTIDDALKFSDMLGEANALGPDDLRAVVQLDATALLEGGDTSAREGVDERAMRLVRDRSHRRDERAKRETEKAQSQRDSLDSEIDRRVDQRVKAALATSPEDLARAESFRRQRIAWPIVAVAGLLALLNLLLGWTTGTASVVLLLALAVLCLDAIRYTKNHAVSGWELFLAACAAGIWQTMALVIS